MWWVMWLLSYIDQKKKREKYKSSSILWQQNLHLQHGVYKVYFSTWLRWQCPLLPILSKSSKLDTRPSSWYTLSPCIFIPFFLYFSWFDFLFFFSLTIENVSRMCPWWNSNPFKPTPLKRNWSDDQSVTITT